MNDRRVTQISPNGTVTTRDDARPLTVAAGDAVIVERGCLRSLIVRCPCGCGDDLVINLDRRTGPAWRLYSRKSKLSLSPSYWRDSACECHFILWKNRIYWCGYYDNDYNDYSNPALEAGILPHVPKDDFVDYHVIAETLDEIPWDVLWCCRNMVNRGLLSEKAGKERGLFSRIS
jgi:hypothetical protein